MNRGVSLRTGKAFAGRSERTRISRCCARCSTPYMCGNSACRCHVAHAPAVAQSVVPTAARSDHEAR